MLHLHELPNLTVDCFDPRRNMKAQPIYGQALEKNASLRLMNNERYLISWDAMKPN